MGRRSRQGGEREGSGHLHLGTGTVWKVSYPLVAVHGLAGRWPALLVNWHLVPAVLAADRNCKAVETVTWMKSAWEKLCM